ncbi:MAG: hypothetical protein Q9227_000942 [Pyrenula ochraceoflavens]
MSASQDELLSNLITANHILHHHGIFDAFGHVSVRNPQTNTTFFMANNTLAALVSKASELLEFQIDGGAPVDPNLNIGPSERYIHSELYKRYPDVNAVVHSHSSHVIPFSVVKGMPLRPVIHTAGFLGGGGEDGVPVWDIAKAYSSSDSGAHDMQVRNPRLGASYASAFSKSATLAGSVYETISAKILPGGGQQREQSALPDYPAVLMRGHGFSLAAKGLAEAVYQAVFTQEAAKVLGSALGMERGKGEGTVEGRVDVEGGGKIKAGKLRIGEECHYLSGREAADASAAMQMAMRLPWALWKKEVERSGLYDNEFLQGK